MLQLIEAQLYPEGHAYQREIGGDDRQIASAALKDACGFMKNYYAPERATVLIAGNVDITTSVSLCCAPQARRVISTLNKRSAPAS